MLCFAAFRGKATPLEELGLPAKGRVALAREGVHRSTCRGSPKKTGPEAEGCAPSVSAELGRFFGTKAHLFCKKNTESGEQYCNVPGWREAGWERVLPISNFRGRKRQLQERVHEALAANSCGNDSSFKPIIIFKRRAEICS